MSRTIIKDLNLNKLFDLDSLPESINEFFESYESPYNLIIPKLWYVDGAGWNGKISRICYGIPNSLEHDLRIVQYPFELSNNEAEYDALLSAMVECEVGDVIYCDSQLIVNQVLGLYECRAENLIRVCNIARRLYFYRKLTLVWIPREQNLAGQLLER